MWDKLKQILLRLFRRKKLARNLSIKTSQALRQLNNQYVQQKRLWVYIILSSIGLVVSYILCSIFWSQLWEHKVIIPAAWTILAGIFIAIFQVRRCNDVIHILRQAYHVELQVEKAQAEKEALEAADMQKQTDATIQKPFMDPKPSSNGANRPPDSLDME